jgi:hypothetical protein
VKQITCTLLIKQIGGRTTRSEEKTQVLGAYFVLWVYIFADSLLSALLNMLH